MKKNLFLSLRIVLPPIIIFLIGSTAPLWGYEAWKGKPPMDLVKGKAKIKVKGEIREIPVFEVTQENCIFREAEITPEKWTNAHYKQPECVTLRNKRVREFSDGKNPPAETKMFHVPANQYFKVKMTISKKMANRRGEQFGFQIVKKGAGTKTVFIVGGWEVGDSKLTKAIRLKPGQYYWRCPQNRTPWYGMIVE
ncbi:MAG: hypothetical protein HQM13_15255 [SAR324 cluster bacterium]|nr:hypothetical protein [SAR324 cluster bacterium]